MKTVLIPLANGFEEIEAVTTIDVLRRAEIGVVTVGLPGTIIRGAQGMQLLTDHKIEDVNPKSFDALVLVGGDPGYKNLGNSKKIIDIIQDFNTSNKTIAAICAAPIILARMGILDDKRATICPGMERQLPKPRPERVVVDRNVITAQGPGSAMEFSFAIIESLLGKKVAEKLKRELVC